VESAERESGPEGLDRAYLLAIAAAFAIVTALGILILSARFGIGTPSITDDWLFASATDKNIWDYLKSFVDPVGRYRPAWEVSQYIQWQTLGAPGSLVGPNAWAVLRTILFAAGLVVVPGVVAATQRPRPSPILLGALGVGVGLFVFSGPVSDVDFLRLGVQEQVLVGGPICGAALIVWATGRLLDPDSAPARWLVICAFALGYFLWLAGLYFKEASVAAFVMLPFLYLHLDRRWRERGLIDGPLWRVRSVQVVAAALVLPLVGVLIGARSVSDTGIGLYGASPPHGIDGYVDRAVDAMDLEWRTLGDFAKMPIWQIAAVAVSVFAIVVAIYRRRVPWLAIGFVLTAWVILDLQGFLLSPQVRYVIPAVALFAIAGYLLLAESPPWLGYAAVVAALGLAIYKADDASSELDAWVDREQQDNSRILQLIAERHPSSCPVYVYNFAIEHGESVPKLLPLEGIPLTGPCTPGYEGILVGLHQPYPGPQAADAAILKQCSDAGGPTVLATTPGLDHLPRWVMMGCRHFRHDPMADRLLRENRIVPGTGLTESKAAADASLPADES